MDASIIDELNRLRETRERGVLALVLESKGSAPQEAGARLILRQDGTVVGTIGGGSFEHQVIEQARTMLESGAREPKVIGFRLEEDLGMRCGGTMKAYLEPIGPRPRLVVFGAGHVGYEVAAMATRLPVDVLVVDDRQDFATKERFPGCQVMLAPFTEVAGTFRPTPDDYLIIMTYGHDYDQVLLSAFVEGPQAYLGLIASKRKRDKAFALLREAGVPEEAISRVHSPIGLPIGAVTPAEIAVSILAEIIQVMRSNGARA